MAILKLQDGTIVPGATTIVKLLDKPYLIKWANNLGKQGIDVEEYKQREARLGILIHQAIESHNTKKEIDVSDYTEEEFKNAATVFYEHYLKWERCHNFIPLKNELQLVSEQYKFGGIIDAYGILDGKYTVIDYKTGKSISNDQILQLSSYIQLLQENGYQVDQILILDVRKTISLPLEEKYLTIDEALPYWEMFKHLIEVYWIKKSLNWK